ncbi:hypothetical protein GCM10008090_29090 [Arenicella chitinivorans]|uniref:HTH araC/xylS-type domain-containing protein n=1 Tax=Arenicella chitinivorans TaxID=1329800 RepID=A0A918S0F8_9GAMM|nr:AraC family transcriptional regulator [Arenicella chitinivorans]GHA17565.1 hypothetical protein GCM10008090_29090 [Arenicella chitinivorans]
MSYRWYTERHDPVHDVHGSLSAIADLSLHFGVPETQLLRSMRIKLHDLIQPNSKCSAEQLLQLIDNIQSLNVKLPELPFRAAAMASEQFSFPIRALLRSCSNVRSRLQLLMEYQQLINPLIRLEMYQDEEFHYLLLADRYGHGANADFVLNYSAALVLALLRDGAQHRPHVTVFLSASEPRNVADHYHYLTDQMVFDACFNLIAIPANSLDQNDQVMASLSQQRYSLACREYKSRTRLAPSLIDECIRYVDGNLSTPSLGLSACADHFHKSTSTLKRKLKMHEYSFQTILDERVVLHSLLNLFRGASAGVLATQLNYSNTANFRRMFRRCTGVWPQSDQSHIFYPLWP